MYVQNFKFDFTAERSFNFNWQLRLKKNFVLQWNVKSWTCIRSASQLNGICIFELRGISDWHVVQWFVHPCQWLNSLWLKVVDDSISRWLRWTAKVKLGHEHGRFTLTVSRQALPWLYIHSQPDRKDYVQLSRQANDIKQMTDSDS